MSLQVYTSFQKSLSEAVADAELMRETLGKAFNARGQYSYTEDLGKQFDFMVVRVKKFTCYSMPTPAEQLEIFRLLGARKVYIQKALESEKQAMLMPTAVIQIITGYLATDAQGVEESDISYYLADRVNVPPALAHLGKTLADVRKVCSEMDQKKYGHDYMYARQEEKPEDCFANLYWKETTAYDKKLTDALDAARYDFGAPRGLADELKMMMLLTNLEDRRAVRSSCKVEEITDGKSKA